MGELLNIDKAAMIWKYHSHTLQTNPWHPMEEPQIPYLEQLGARRLSGRVQDSRPKGRGFEPHRRHCVVVLEQDTFILA